MASDQPSRRLLGKDLRRYAPALPAQQTTGKWNLQKERYTTAEYTKGTWLKQFLDRLDEAERGDFEADYRRRVTAAYPKEADGRTLFPFRRLFILARKPY